MKGCILRKMTTLGEEGREEKQSSPILFIQVKSNLSDWRAAGKHEGVVAEEEQPVVGLYVCGIYTLTLIAFYRVDASPCSPPLCCPRSLQLCLSGPQTGSSSTFLVLGALPPFPVLWAVGAQVGGWLVLVLVRQQLW